MYHHVKELMYTVRVDEPDPRFGNMLLKHLLQTEGHVERLPKAFELLGADAQAKPCKAMQGLIAEGEETIKEGTEEQPLAADLALITAAKKVEHYEISGYGTVRTLGRQIREVDVSDLLTHTLGEEERTDFLLTEVAKPLIQQAASEIYEAHAGKKQTGGV